MNSVFIRSSIIEEVPLEYSAGLVLGPVAAKPLCGFNHTLNRLLCRPTQPNPAVESLATLALATYMADKGYKRSAAQDAWTRELIVDVPINSDFRPAVPILGEGLRFLSGDSWRIETRTDQAPIGAGTSYKDDFVADAVCLFSGGTDSLTGAINLLEDGRSLILLSHFERGSDAGIQKGLARNLIIKYGPNRVRHRSIQVCSAVSVETSTRARSFLFIALGLMTASAFGNDAPLYIPENGFVGINVPLTGSRQGSYSTRTTHPAYLASIREGLRVASIGHGLINPFARLSKGEVLQSCKKRGLLEQLLPLTLSCAKAGSLRWKGHSPATNCGLCYPCLMRRAALHTINADDPNGYAYDAIGSPHILAEPRLGGDLRCLLQATSRYSRSSRPSFLEILKSGSISAVENPAELIHPVEAGFEEVVTLLRDKGCSEIRRYAYL